MVAVLSCIPLACTPIAFACCRPSTGRCCPSLQRIFAYLSSQIFDNAACMLRWLGSEERPNCTASKTIKGTPLPKPSGWKPSTNKRCHSEGDNTSSKPAEPPAVNPGAGDFHLSGYWEKVSGQQGSDGRRQISKNCRYKNESTNRR